MPAEDVATGPGGRLSAGVAALGTVNAQALQVFVFCINRHKKVYALSLQNSPPHFTNRAGH